MGPSSRLLQVEHAFPDLPYMTVAQAGQLQAFLAERDLSECLELGFFHGKSSAFIAAMLEERGCGHLTTIDRQEAAQRTPNIDTVLATLDLTHRVTWHYEHSSYTWRLMKLLEESAEPRFDFCYIDGGHSWDVSGFGFLLTDRLLKPGGWVLFDDLDWTYSQMVPGDGPVPGWLAQKSAEEIETAQVRKVWELLVKTHPNYDSFGEDGQWGFARKKP